MPLIISLAAFSFISYLCTGIPLAVLPSHVHGELGFSATIAGVVTGIQYLVTLLCRPMSGYLGDTLGAKRTAMLGLSLCVFSGALLALSSELQSWPGLALALILGNRILLGVALGMIGNSAINWCINRLGAESTARMISWNGIAAYGGIGIGAPLGVLMKDVLGFWSLGVASIVLAGAGLYMAGRKAAPPIMAGERLPFHSVLAKVLPFGGALLLGSIGYGTLSAFITLYYQARGWDGAAWCLTAYACTYIGVRIVLTDLVQRTGGYRVAVLCLATEAVGMLMVWMGDQPVIAITGSALAGAGLALLYPALGVEIISRVTPANRGAALGTFAMFFDLSLGVAGLLMGGLASLIGMRHIFLCAALLGFAGMWVALTLSRRHRTAQTP
jgi:MFS family permease